MWATSGTMPMHHDMASMPWGAVAGAPWYGGAASSLAMWIAMTAAMMLPSVAPALWRYRRALAAVAGTHPNGSTLVAGAAYLAVWAAIGLALLPLGVVAAGLERWLPMPDRLAPIAVGIVVLLAGTLQLTAWKARHLASCRTMPASHRAAPADVAAAWRDGLRLGRHCVLSCAGPMACLLAAGVMDVRAMLVATAAITVERVAPSGERVARRVVGLLGVAAGCLLIARAGGLG